MIAPIDPFHCILRSTPDLIRDVFFEDDTQVAGKVLVIRQTSYASGNATVKQFRLCDEEWKKLLAFIVGVQG